jgi:hypothetical protein
MPWFSILSGAIKLFNRVTKYLNDRELIKAGEVEALSKQLQEAQNEINRGLVARDNASRVRDEHDPFAD